MITPSKAKTPFPFLSTLSTGVSQQPKTYPTWRSALQGVKLLYLSRQYKQCTVRCVKLLEETEIHAVYRAFLHMYAAVCNELIARSNHYLSAQKLPLMILAKEHYQKAASALPAPRPEEPESSSTMNDITLGLSRLNSDASFASTITSGKRPRPFSYGSEIDSEVTRPSPLRIRKAVRFSGPPPSFILPRSAPTSRRNSLQLDDNTDVWLRLRALERFNNHLVSLSESIQDHLKAVDSQIISISEAQANWKLPIPFKLHAGAPQEDINLVEKRARIERLRANGWKRERYCGARYEDLCQRALAEL